MTPMFSVVFVLLNVYAILVNWKRLKHKADRVLFIGMATISFGLIVLYHLNISNTMAPANWAVRMIDRYMGAIF